MFGRSKNSLCGLLHPTVGGVQSLSHVQPSGIPWTAASQAPRPSLSPGDCSDSCPLSRWCYITILSLPPPFAFAFSLSQHQGLFQWLSSSHQWPKYWSFKFSIHPSSEYSGLISFRIDWFDLLAVRGTLKGLQHHNLKTSVLWCSALFMVQLSYPYMTTGKTIVLTIWTFVGKVMFLLFNTLSRFVMAFLPRSKHHLISWLQSPSHWEVFNAGCFTTGDTKRGPWVKAVIVREGMKGKTQMSSQAMAFE